MWTLLSFPLFLLLTETAILGLPAGPSRYLYLASACSALLITGAMIPLDGGNLAKNAGGTHPGMPNAPDEQVGLD